jgi:hypothetical protein
MPFPCGAHAAVWLGLEKSLSKLHGRGTARARHGMCELAFEEMNHVFLTGTKGRYFRFVIVEIAQLKSLPQQFCLIFGKTEFSAKIDQLIF